MIGPTATKSWKHSANLQGQKNGGTAVLSGTRFDFGRTRLAFLYRSYQRNFQNQHAFAFGERNGASQNEIGYYAGMKIRISRKTILSAYYDIYRFPWRSFFEPQPVNGNDFLSLLEHKVQKGLKLSIRFRDKRREQSEDFALGPGRVVEEILERQQRQFRIQIDYRANRVLQLRPRVEFVRNRFRGFGRDVSDKNENGILIYQDIKLTVNRKLKASVRLTIFDTDSFDSRVFQYENDMPGVVTNRALFGRGNRWYFLIRYKPTRQLSVYLKYSETFRDDVDVTGTGANRIESNLDRRIAFQMETRI